MRNRFVTRAALALLLLAGLTFAGCARPKTSFTVPAGPDAKVVQMTASSFRFEPDEILARTGDRLVLQVQNTAGIEHNLTVEDPQGNVLLNLKLPSGQMQPATLELGQPGVYRYYCGKPMHPAMGMTGQIVAGPRK